MKRIISLVFVGAALSLSLSAQTVQEPVAKEQKLNRKEARMTKKEQKAEKKFIKGRDSKMDKKYLKAEKISSRAGRFPGRRQGA